MKKAIKSICLLSLLFLSFLNGGAVAQDQPKKEETAPAPPPAPVIPERSYELPYDAVWEKIIETLKQKELYIHPHGKTIEDKENGKITTPTFRYFAIISAANPVIELDYTDQYTIMAIRPPEPKKEEPKAEPAKEETKEGGADATAANAPAGEKGVETPAEPAGKVEAPAAEKAQPEPEVPKGPPVIKVQIQRKFQKHNGLPNPQGAWVDANPKQENNIGISEEDLFKTLDLLVASIPKPAPATMVPAAAPASPAGGPASTTSTKPEGK